MTAAHAENRKGWTSSHEEPCITAVKTACKLYDVKSVNLWGPLLESMEVGLSQSCVSQSCVSQSEPIMCVSHATSSRALPRIRPANYYSYMPTHDVARVLYLSIILTIARPSRLPGCFPSSLELNDEICRYNFLFGLHFWPCT